MSRDLGAFRLHLDRHEVAAASGPLAGLTFAVKDVFDVAGIVTGGGNPDWLQTHRPARRTAPAVEACLKAGARLKGIAIADELAFSLLGENAHYGTPLNPAAPDRVPGGSSSGSASAVAGGLVAFALGTDTAGSIRVPASYCGIYGIRPTHGRISVKGVLPLSPSFDTVGWLTREASVLERVGNVLLDGNAPPRPIRRILLLEDAFALADEETRRALEKAAVHVSEALAPLQRTTLSMHRFADWLGHYNALRPPEIWAAYGAWITQTRPHFGPQIAERFAAAAKAATADTAEARAFRAEVQAEGAARLGDDAVFMLPSTPTIAPKKGASETAASAFREHTLRLSCISPMLGLPEISLPLATAGGCPVGLSLIGQANGEGTLLRAAVGLSSST